MLHRHPPDTDPIQRRSKPPPHQLARLASLPLVVAALLLIVIGCQAERDYRLLSFFFDGVPVPESMREELEQLAAAGQEGEETPSLVQEEPPITYYFHTPYANRSCFGCHDRQAGFTAATGGADLCKQCHDTYFAILPDDWAHGPATLGECRRCHEPHKSPNPRGLTTLPQPALCFDCHDEGSIRDDPLHAQLKADVICSTCHDPHAAGNRLLLVDARSYQRRKASPWDIRSAHNMWTQEDCAHCHDPQQANQVLPDVDQACVECHGDVQATMSDPLVHQAVRDGRCTVCHTPHKSSRPHLMRPTAEQTCYTCHKPEELDTPDHPSVVRADCLICHAGHHSDEPHLLKLPEQVIALLDEEQAVAAQPAANVEQQEGRGDAP